MDEWGVGSRSLGRAIELQLRDVVWVEVWLSNDATIPPSEDAEESELNALNVLWTGCLPLPFGICTVFSEIEATTLKDKIVHQVCGEGSGEVEALLEVSEIAVGAGLTLLDDRLCQDRVDRREAQELF